MSPSPACRKGVYQPASHVSEIYLSSQALGKCLGPDQRVSFFPSLLGQDPRILEGSPSRGPKAEYRQGDVRWPN